MRRSAWALFCLPAALAASELPPRFATTCAGSLAGDRAVAAWNDAVRGATSAPSLRERLEAVSPIRRYGVASLGVVFLEPVLDRDNRFGNSPPMRLGPLGGWPVPGRPAEAETEPALPVRYHPNTVRNLLLEAEREGAVLGWRSLEHLAPRGLEILAPGEVSVFDVFEHHRRLSLVAGLIDLGSQTRWKQGFNWLLPFFADRQSAREIDRALAWFFRTRPFDEDEGYADFVLMEEYLFATDPDALPAAKRAYLDRTKRLFVEGLRGPRLGRYYTWWVASDLRDADEEKHFGTGALREGLRALADQTERGAFDATELLTRAQAFRYLRLFGGARRDRIHDFPELPTVGSVSVAPPVSRLWRRALQDGGDAALEAQQMATAFYKLDVLVARGSSGFICGTAHGRLEMFFREP